MELHNMIQRVERARDAMGAASDALVRSGQNYSQQMLEHEMNIVRGAITKIDAVLSTLGGTASQETNDAD
jgi:HAMP domain-containing protein